MFKLIIFVVALSQVRSETWVPWSGLYSGLPAGAVHGGNELEGTYVIRAYFNGGLIPGKFAPSQYYAFISTNNEEHAVQTFEVTFNFNHCSL